MTKPRKTAKPTGSAADFIPPRPTLAKLRAASKGCQGCDLFKVGTQTVCGEGPGSAHVMVVGEQPGDVEDRVGKPFVGPSGKLLDRAFDGAGIDRDDVYVTNAVKHFKWAKDARSTRRIHKTPNAGEIRACFPWLQNEIALVQPQVIVCLGATAAKASFGKAPDTGDVEPRNSDRFRARASGVRNGASVVSAARAARPACAGGEDVHGGHPGRWTTSGQSESSEANDAPCA